jgi:hypothetical protein
MRFKRPVSTHAAPPRAGYAFWTCQGSTSAPARNPGEAHYTFGEKRVPAEDAVMQRGPLRGCPSWSALASVSTYAGPPEAVDAALRHLRGEDRVWL